MWKNQQLILVSISCPRAQEKSCRRFPDSWSHWFSMEIKLRGHLAIIWGLYFGEMNRNRKKTQFWVVHNEQCLVFTSTVLTLFRMFTQCKTSPYPTLGNSGRVKSIENSVQRTHYERHLMKEVLGTIPILRHQKDWVGWFLKMVSFSDVQHCIYQIRLVGQYPSLRL